jgi:Na+/H+ antiporter NhaD/arsenite permease-like protein
MTLALTLIFIITYAAIAFEHVLKVDKSASALIGAGLLWTVYAMGLADPPLVSDQLGHSLMTTAQIVFFLIGAMTIVEVIDAHDGFDVITARIKTTKLQSLMWVIACVTFFLSAVLDNLTTTIVMVSLMRKLHRNTDERLLFAGIIIIAANAGGAWSPIGDVTTTMLWIGGQITPLPLIKSLFLPSVANLLVPLLVLHFWLRGKPVLPPVTALVQDVRESSVFERNIMFWLGLGVLVAVPVFKAITHLPPFVGILFGLGLLWAVGDIVHRKKAGPARQRVTIAHALTRIDMSAIVFFIGILLAVATLEHQHILTALAGKLDQSIGNQSAIVFIIGLVSAVVDNVPIVAAAMGMYPLGAHPPDSLLWTFLAYCAGTGGSILVIGSAAGVAAMGLEKIGFFWYVKKMSGLAMLGYVAGAMVFLSQHMLAG